MLDKVLKEIKEREIELANAKAKAKSDALKVVIELIEGFGITAGEIFKDQSKPTRKASKLPSIYKSAGLIENDLLVNPLNSNEIYKYVKVGKKPDWLRDALQSGKKRADLLKSIK